MRTHPDSPVTRPIPDRASLRRRCISTLGIDPATVTIRLDPEPARRGCWALAINETILLAPQALTLDEPSLQQLLGHELCHIAQQRCARQRGERVDCAADEPALEAQAERWGAALRDARTPCDRHPLPASPAIARPAVWIGGRRIRQIADLPTPTEAALALIPRATAWLKDAAASQTIELSFPDPPAFLLGVLRGLYATDLIFLRRAQAYIGPRRLLELDSDTIDQLLSHESNEATTKPQSAQPINRSTVTVATPPAALKKHRILTAADFAASFALLKALEADDAPLFQVRQLDELIRLHDAIGDPSMPDARSPLAGVAIRFALDRATTIAEFADALTLFLRVAEVNEAIKNLAEATTDTTGPAGDPAIDPAHYAEHYAAAEAVAAQAAIIWETLIDASGTWLLTPAFGFPVANTAELTALLRQHLEFGQSLGFQSPSAGARQVAAYLARNALLHAPTPNVVRAYIERVQRCVAEGTLGEPSFTQSGTAQQLPVTNNDTSVRLMIDATGCITIESLDDDTTPSKDSKPATTTKPQAAAHKKP